MVAYVRNDLTDFDQKSDWYDELKIHMGLVNSVWSIYEVNDFNAVPYPDMKTLMYTDNWGTPQKVEFERAPTWADLWEGADLAIGESGDVHHVFIEKFVPKNGALYLVTGS